MVSLAHGVAANRYARGDTVERIASSWAACLPLGIERTSDDSFLTISTDISTAGIVPLFSSRSGSRLRCMWCSSCFRFPMYPEIPPPSGCCQRALPFTQYLLDLSPFREFIHEFVQVSDLPRQRIVDIFDAIAADDTRDQMCIRV